MQKNEITKNPASTLVYSSGVSDKYLPAWIDSHRSTFEDCMERLADELPQKYCELYIKMIQIANQQKPTPKQTNIDSMTVNVSSKLDTLADVHDTSWRKDSAYTNYEEVTDGK